MGCWRVGGRQPGPPSPRFGEGSVVTGRSAVPSQGSSVQCEPCSRRRSSRTTHCAAYTTVSGRDGIHPDADRFVLRRPASATDAAGQLSVSMVKRVSPGVSPWLRSAPRSSTQRSNIAGNRAAPRTTGCCFDAGRTSVGARAPPTMDSSFPPKGTAERHH